MDLGNWLNPNYLIAGLVWSAVGAGMISYARKRGEIFVGLGGLAILAVTFFAATILSMSLMSLAVIGVLYGLQRLGYW